jgi:hypothetical protein
MPPPLSLGEIPTPVSIGMAICVKSRSSLAVTSFHIALLNGQIIDVGAIAVVISYSIHTKFDKRSISPVFLCAIWLKAMTNHSNSYCTYGNVDSPFAAMNGIILMFMSEGAGNCKFRSKPLYVVYVLLLMSRISASA